MCNDRHDESSAMLTALPSFGHPPKLSASPYTISPQNSSPAEADEDCSNEDFEFSLLIRDYETHLPIAADKIFSNGHILPVYPVLANTSAAFTEKPKRQRLLQLLMEEHDWLTSETSSSYTDELEGIPLGTYCLWPPAQSNGSVSKCCSTGSMLLWWIRDLVLRRSNSDRKKVVIRAAEEKRSTERKLDAEGSKNKGKEMDLITAHRLYYVQNCRGGSRKSCLPYKPEIGGLFHRAG
ncbi:uncharacterized protein LOC110101788 [Dendrobium catenatum]|uniref:Uncharacterized protein n=1 Tax=Dendrobium catenatum TaxID=906689 RepID=A0A2I0WD66_9ASPA|nr:uncharacterized protein LOC110101788 [Dendrobium catenatum]PKU73582.1 hypothetical protein MA16_Dca026249 [Dendrobium catenatum]